MRGATIRERGGWPIVGRHDATGVAAASAASGTPHLHLLVGPAGVGKSELARSLALELAGDDAIVITALSQQSSTPLGAVDELLRDLGSAELTDVASAVEAIGGRAGRRLLVVDDAPRLDHASAEVIRRLIVGFGAVVIATARTSEALPAPLAGVDSAIVTEHTITGFSVNETAELLEAVFRVPARSSDVHRVVLQTGGNPLHVRIVIEAALREGRVLHRGAEVEIIDGGPVASLDETISAAVQSLSSDEADVLDVIRHVQPVHPLSLLGTDDRSSAIESLLRRGLIVADEASGRLWIAHPLVAEAQSATGMPRAREDVLRILRASGIASQRYAAVALEQDAGQSSSWDELMWAASFASARGDHASAASLAEAAGAMPTRRGPLVAACVAAGAYRSRAGDVPEAESWFARATELVETPAERASLASALGAHLAFRVGDAQAAVEQGLRARTGVSAPEAVALDADLWRWRILADRQASGGEADLSGAIAATVAATMRGEPTAAARASAPLRTSASLGDFAPTAAIAVGIQKLVEIRATSDAAHAAAFLESARAQAGDEVGFFTLMLASHRIHEGRLTAGTELADLAIEQLGRHDPGELLPLALALRATASAQLGDVAGARRRLLALDDVAVSGAAVLQRAECRAYLLAAEGRLVEASDEIIAVVTDALGSGYRFLGALTLSTALRFGEIERTRALAEKLNQDLPETVEPIAAILDFAESLHADRPARVPDSARRLARAGLVMAAVDGASLALARPASEHTRRRLRSVISAVMSDIDAPLLHRTTTPALTPREREVARAAADRLRSREIAERLGITTRTVENQLYSAYRKLGVTSRDELRQALDTEPLSDVGKLTEKITKR